MKVGYFCLQSLWTFHFVHDLELIQADLEQGNEVHVIRPGKRMRFSDTAWRRQYNEALPAERSRFAVGMSQLSGRVAVHTIDELAEQADDFCLYRVAEWPSFESAEALNDFQFAGHDCGNAVRSSLISHFRDTYANPHEHQAWVENALDASVLVYLAAQAFIKTHKPDRLYTFNGRMSTFRGVLRACQEAGIECVVHERGSTLNRIGLSVNTMPHDIYWVQREIERQWRQDPSSEDQKREIGKAFYEKKRENHVFNWYAYTEHQRKNWLPDRVKQCPRVFSIFTSSEFERFALPQYYRYLLHKSQLAGIVDVVQILKEDRFDGALCIRIHPNSHNEQPSLLESLKASIREHFVHILPADSPADTYALIDASEKVITFGSTVAMEAAYWGKPSVSFATNPYEALDAIYQPEDREAAVGLLTQKLEPKGYDDCLKYGYFYSTFGRQLRYSTVVDMFDLRFKGRRIREGFAYRKLYRHYQSLKSRWRGAA